MVNYVLLEGPILKLTPRLQNIFHTQKADVILIKIPSKLTTNVIWLAANVFYPKLHKFPYNPEKHSQVQLVANQRKYGNRKISFHVSQGGQDNYEKSLEVGMFWNSSMENILEKSDDIRRIITSFPKVFISIVKVLRQWASIIDFSPVNSILFGHVLLTSKLPDFLEHPVTFTEKNI